MDQRGYAWLVVAAGVATTIFSLALLVLSWGGKGVMVQFELAKNWNDIHPILGSISDPAALLDPQLKVDYGFLLSYPLLNAALFLFVRHLAPVGSWVRSPLVLALGLTLAVLMLMGDAIENTELLNLTKLPPTQELPIPAPLFAQILSWLGLFSRLKWGALGVASVILGLAFLVVPPEALLFRGAGLVLLLAFVAAGGLCLWGVLAGQVKPIQWSVSAFIVPWLLSIAEAAWILRRG
ncbi:MAG TPA: hypothetical protein VH394_19835 [Thermoanaerobaculia bacterium]|nr:hypothetical protein [Thermoanaerobaculia bacterium]